MDARLFQIQATGRRQHLVLESRSYEPAALVRRLEPLIREERRLKIEAILERRSLDYPIVMDRVHNYGNIAAVFRSAEAMGFQALHLVKDPDGQKLARRSSLGAERWLSLNIWDHAKECADFIKSAGYQLAVTDVSAEAKSLDSVDFLLPTAVVIGKEVEGVGPVFLSKADVRIKLPMAGFTESYNLSVAAGMLLQRLFQVRSQRAKGVGDLTELEKSFLRAKFYLRSVPRPELHIREIQKSLDVLSS